MDVNYFVPFTLSLDDNEITKHVLGKEKDNEEKAKDEDEDDTQAETVAWKASEEEMQTIKRFSKSCSSISEHDVMKFYCIYSNLLKIG